MERRPGDLIDKNRWFHSLEPLEGLPLLIETSPPIANLLMRAEEGIDRRDWKLAIDSLQRVIDDRTGTLVPRDDGAHQGALLFESGRRRALRRLASMPAEGLLAYRVLYDGKAKGLYERARAASDLAEVQAVADRFLLTRHGDVAADWVASRAIDEGRFGEAVSRLNDILTFVPDTDLPAERVYSKMYAAYMVMGLADKAQQTLDGYRARIQTQEGAVDRSTMIAEGLGDAWAQQTQQRIVQEEVAQESLPRRMGPQLRPSLSGSVPWGYELMGTSADLWRRIADFDPGDPAPIPRLELAGSRQQVYVRIPGGCAALDMEDLGLLWKTVSAPLPRVSDVEDPRRGGPVPTPSRTPGPYFDDPTNRISAAEGLVFTIERQGIGEFLDKDEVQAGGILFVRPGPRTFRSLNGTRLTAYDEQSGDVRWRRGRTDDAGDVLGNVRFLSPPLAVNGQLWAPFLRGVDLYVAAIRPADGALLQQVLVGSIREPAQVRDGTPQQEPVVPLALAEGVVFVPTGIGSLAAIDMAGMKLRWTYMYDAQSGGRRRTDIPARWVPSPPMIDSGVVVVAAPDFQEVLGLDAATGSHLWTAAMDDCSYTIAAHKGMIWLGGRRVACLSMADGRELWSTDISGTPTGRAALCGDQIHVPVDAGLLLVDAATGDQVGLLDLPASQAPLGNIACVGASLYSIEPSSVRKFPDLDRMHEAALRELASRPDAVESRIRLAWAELLRGQPRAAYDAVAGIPPDQPASARARMSLARVKIESVLAIAQLNDSPQESLRLLEAASPDDLTPALRLRYRSAVADQLRALGRLEEAYRVLLTTALSSDAGELGPTEDGVRVAARFGLASRMVQLWDVLDEATRTKLLGESQERVRELTSAATVEANAELLAWVQVHEGTQIGQAALLGLAQIQLRAREFEQAEQTLLQCIRNSDDAGLTVSAQIRLALMYLDSEQFSPGLIWHALETLEQIAESQTPGSGVASRHADDFPMDADIHEIINKLRASLSGEREQLGLASMYAEPGTERAGLSLSGRTAWSYEVPGHAEPARAVLFEEGIPHAVADRVIVLGRDGFLECVKLENKDVLWRAKLQLPGTFDESTDAGSRSQSVARYGVSDGQTVILNGPDGMFAVGVVTGRLLWAKAFDRAVMDPAGSAARDRIMSARNGMVVAAPRDGFLTMMRVVDGSVVWERDLRGESVARVWLDEDAVVFADAEMKRVHLLRPGDGSLISRILLRQPGSEHERVNLVLSEGMLFGPDRGGATDGIAGYELSSGRQSWRMEVDKPIMSLFEPKAGFLGVGLLGGDVKILNSRSGEVVLQHSDPSVRAVSAGVMWAGTLILRSTVLRGSKQCIELAAFDIATGAQVWRSQEISALGPANDRLEVVSGVIPALIEQIRNETTTKSGNKQSGGGARAAALVTLIDSRTGLDSGTPTEVAAFGQGVSVNGDMVLWPGALIVGSLKGIQSIRVELTALPERGF